MEVFRCCGTGYASCLIPAGGRCGGETDIRTGFRWMVRARYYTSIARGIGRAWFHFAIATHGSVEGHETREDGLAKNPRTNYQAGYRYGSHQSITRAWLRPTLRPRIARLSSRARKESSGRRWFPAT